MTTGKRLFYYALKEKKTIIIALLMLMISVGAELIGPLLIKQMIDKHIMGMDGIWAEENLAFYSGEMPAILRLGGIYFILVIIAAIFAYGQKYYLEISSNRIIQRMREDVFWHSQKIPMNYFDRTHAGKIVSRITNDTEAIRELYVTVLATFCSGIIQIIGILIALLFLDVRLALICCIILPILYVWITLYRKFATTYNRRIRARISDINGMINESISGMSIIQIFRQEKRTEEEFTLLNEDYYENQEKLLHLNSATSHNMVGALRNLAFVVIIWYFGGMYFSETMAISMGILYAFVDYLNRLFQPMTGMVNQLANLETAMVSADRFFVLLDEQGEEISKDISPRYEGDVSFEHVSMAYEEEGYVLNDITFHAKKGETVAFVGHTGSGKSSIMNVLFGFYPYQKGKVQIDGKEISKLEKQMYREHMGIVLQDPFLFTGTIASNIGLDHPNITRQQIEAAIKAVGIEPLIERLPQGLDEPVLEKGKTFSAGERQLLSFARALAFDPAILILDEATASVDTETERMVQKALEVLKKNRTTFIIAHRLSTIRHADQILLLDRGQIIERGTHDELMEKKGRYYQMYQIQLQRDGASA